MYRCIKLKRLFLNRSPNSCTNVQYFHVTSAAFVRKVQSKRTLRNVESEYLDDKHVETNIAGSGSSGDLFGIENDEGVITLSQQKHIAPEYVQKPIKREKFYATSFGIVRYDSDNKLKYHGEYGKTVDFKFPQRSHKFVEVSRNPRNLYQQSEMSPKTSDIITSDKQESDVYERKDSSASFIDDYYFSDISQREKSVDNIKASRKSSEDLNFVDENYFKSLNTTENANTSFENSSVLLSAKNEINSLDKDVFENFCSEYENKSETDYESNADKAFSNLQKLSEDNMNFQESNNGKDFVSIKASDFHKMKDQNKNDIHKINLNSTGEKEFESDNHEFLKEDLNFQDKNYVFTQNTTENVKSSENFENERKDIFIDSYSSNDNKFTQSTMHEFSSMPVHSGNNLEDKMFPDFRNSKKFEVNKKANLNLKSNVEVEYNVPIEKNNNSIIDYNNSNNYISRQTLSNDVEKSISSSLTINDNSAPKKRGQLSSKNFNSDVKDNETFATKKGFKYSMLASEKPESENEISTAHDFVTKLRKEQKIQPQILNSGKALVLK